MDERDPIEPGFGPVPGSMFGDRVFVLSMLIHGLPEGVADNVTIDHHLGGPTAAILTFGDYTYRLTIEDE